MEAPMETPSPVVPTSVDPLKPVMIRAGDPALHRSQIRVINVLRGHSRVLSEEARKSVADRITHLGFPADTLDLVVNYLRHSAPIVIHFRPESVLEKFLDDTCYRNLFEIGTGGGCTDKTTRAGWESSRFMNLYDGSVPFERPKYGSMNTLNHPGGTPARSYGPGYMVLQDHVRIRCTMTPGDSSSSATVGSPDYCLHVADSFTENEMLSVCKIARNELPYGKYGHETYREVQIHGELNFARDISRMVLPSSYIGTQYETLANKFVATNDVEFEWYYPEGAHVAKPKKKSKALGLPKVR